MDDWQFEWFVKYGRLYMPSADQLGDPLEGTTPQGELDWWRRKAENADSAEQRRIIEHNRKLLSGFAKKFRRNYYVSCWSGNQFESHAMWKSYTRKIEAVAIQTTYATLRECLPSYCLMGMVRYIDYANERLPTMNMFEYIMHKDVYYRSEHEIRVVGWPEIGGAHFHENFFEREKLSGAFCYAPPVDIIHLINGVVLHPEAPSIFESAVRTLCAENGLPEPRPSRSTRTPFF
jgi:hypothetical protein